MDKVTTEKLSKTSSLLNKIIEDEEQVLLFDKVYKELKSNKVHKLVTSKYSKFIAQLEVEIKVKEDYWQKRLKTIELEHLEQSASLNIVPKENEEYDAAIKQLKYIKIFKRQLNFLTLTSYRGFLKPIRTLEQSCHLVLTGLKNSFVKILKEFY